MRDTASEGMVEDVFDGFLSASLGMESSGNWVEVNLNRDGQGDALSWHVNTFRSGWSLYARYYPRLQSENSPGGKIP